MAMVAIRTCHPLKVSKALLSILAVWPGRLPILEPGQLRAAEQADPHDQVHAEATLGSRKRERRCHHCRSARVGARGPRLPNLLGRTTGPSLTWHAITKGCDQVRPCRL